MAAAAAVADGMPELELKGIAKTKVLWEHDSSLPSLPVPKLEDTMAQYLKSCEPLLTEEEFKHTKAVVGNFLRGSGPELQAVLEDKAESERNWVRTYSWYPCRAAGSLR